MSASKRKRRAFPSVVQVSITNVCDMSCSMCPYAEMVKRSTYKKQHLQMEAWQAVRKGVVSAFDYLKLVCKFFIEIAGSAVLYFFNKRCQFHFPLITFCARNFPAVESHVGIGRTVSVYIFRTLLAIPAIHTVLPYFWPILHKTIEKRLRCQLDN